MPSIDRRNTVFDHVVVGKPSERPIIEKIRYKPNLFSSWREKKIRERGNYIFQFSTVKVISPFVVFHPAVSVFIMILNSNERREKENTDKYTSSCTNNLFKT